QPEYPDSAVSLYVAGISIGKPPPHAIPAEFRSVICHDFDFAVFEDYHPAGTRLEVEVVEEVRVGAAREETRDEWPRVRDGAGLRFVDHTHHFAIRSRLFHDTVAAIRHPPGVGPADATNTLGNSRLVYINLF